jgi:hypothetical protein
MELVTACRAYKLLLQDFSYGVVSSVSGVPVATLKFWKEPGRMGNKALHREVSLEGKAKFIEKYHVEEWHQEAVRRRDEAQERMLSGRGPLANIVGDGTPAPKTKKAQEEWIRNWKRSIAGT